MTQSQVDKLLEPRYEVVANYPGSIFKVGEVIEFFSATEVGKAEKEYWFHSPPTHQNYQDSWFNEYPHLFRLLKWWERRDKNDLPDYVKFYAPLPEKYNIRKVIKWFDLAKDVVRCEDNLRYQLGIAALPATEDEYTAYIESKKSKS